MTLPAPLTPCCAPSPVTRPVPWLLLAEQTAQDAAGPASAAVVILPFVRLALREVDVDQSTCEASTPPFISPPRCWLGADSSEAEPSEA